jgi:hypothetical protein
MSKNEKSTFSSNSGSMYHIFLETKLIEIINQIQKNENLKDEGEVIAHLIQEYGKKNIAQLDQFETNISQTTFYERRVPTVTVGASKFDGNIQFQKLEKILASIKSENVIKKLPQHEIYGLSGVEMIHRFHTKILPVKFSLMCLSEMIVEKDNPWVSLTELKTYTLYSAKIFIELEEYKDSVHSYLSYERSSKRFTEQFVGRKLQKHEGTQMGGACFEMGLIEAKALTYEEEKARGLSNTGSRKIYVTLGKNGKEFVSYKNDLIDFIYNSKENEPDSIFSQQEREFYFKKILPKYKFEKMFVEHLMKHRQIEHTREIRMWFEEKFLEFCNSEFPDVKVPLNENSVRMYSNTIMNRLIEFDVFTKDPESKSGPYTRMQNLGDFV